MSQRFYLTSKELKRRVKKIEPLTASFEIINDHIIITDENGNILYANKAAEFSTGYSKQEMIGKNPGDLWGGKMPKSFYEKMWRTIKFNKKPFIGSVLNIRKNGQEYWQELRISPILNKKGEAEFFIGIEPEITAPDRIKTSLIKESEQHLARAQYISRVGSLEWDLVKNKMYWSAELYDILGISSKQVKSTQENFLKFVYPEDRKYLLKFFEELKEDFQSREIVFRIIKQTGEELILHARLSVIVNGNQKEAIKIVGVIQDITERKQFEESQYELRRKLQYSISSILAEFKSIEETEEKILQNFTEILDYELAQLWIVNEKENELKMSLFWKRPSFNPKNFIKISQKTIFSIGIGLPGRILRLKEPSWISDITRDPNFPRFRHAKVADLHGAFGFPIIKNNKVAAIIEVFSARIISPDQDLLNTVKIIGEQIGNFISQKELDNKIRESEMYLFKAEEIAHFGHFIWSIEKNKTEWSSEIYKILDLSSQRPYLSFEEFLNFIVPEDRSTIVSSIKKLIKKKGSQMGFFSILKNNGQKRQLQFWINAVEDLKKEIKLIGVIQDVTEQKITQEFLESKTKNETILFSISDGIVAIGLDEKVIFINRAAENALGWKTNELFGKKFTDIVRIQDSSGADIPTDQRPIIIALRRGISIATSTESLSYYFIRKDGTKFPISVTVAPLILNNAIIGAMTVFRDVSKEIEINRVRNEFIAFASHQLRTPLTAISWIAEVLLKKEKISDKGQVYLNDIRLSIRRLSELVDLFLTVSRLESGKMPIQPETFDIVKIIQFFLEEYEPLYVQKNINFIFKDYPEKLNVILDQNMARNILISLISNAIDYAYPGGEVVLSLKKQNGTFLFQIKDSGIGIAKEDQGHIFERFYRAPNARLIKPSGSGLGLFMVKETVELLGGKIWFESEENKGATFFVQLPLRFENKNGKMDNK
ncbi:MAG: PAS domain S-box protein [Parcubacteria group bacterium]|nr:PAS domain S-box protein [Parcubacteria group bacterium]